MTWLVKLASYITILGIGIHYLLIDYVLFLGTKRVLQ